MYTDLQSEFSEFSANAYVYNGITKVLCEHYKIYTFKKVKSDKFHALNALKYMMNHLSHAGKWECVGIFFLTCVEYFFLGTWYILFLVTENRNLRPIIFLSGDRTEILATNFGCCGKFTFSGNRYDMLAMSTIAMSVETWREVE